MGCLRVVCLQEALIGFRGLLGFVQPLQGHSTHNLNTSLILVKVLGTGIGTLAILVQEHLRTVYPVDGLCIATGFDIGLTGIDRANYSFLEPTARRVRLPAVGIVATSCNKALVSFLVLSEVQLTTTDRVQQDGIVDIGTDS